MFLKNLKKKLSAAWRSMKYDLEHLTGGGILVLLLVSFVLGAVIF